MVAPCKSTASLPAATQAKITLFLSASKDQCGTEYDSGVVAEAADSKSYVYACAGASDWFLGRGMAQNEVAFQMIAILGGKTLAAGMAAATIALSLF